MEILLSIIILALVVGGMSLGVLFGRKPIQGSCGGLNNLGLKGECEICGGNPNKCDSKTDAKNSNTDLAVDATRKDATGK